MSDRTTPRILSADERDTLARVLDEIIPPSADGRMPGAGTVGVAAYVELALEALPELSAMVAQGLADLDAASRARHGQRFVDLADDERRPLVAEQSFVFPLTLHTYVGYYQHPRVVEALGMEARPPHPGGYAMAPDDLGLLDAVRRGPKRFRDC